MKAGGGIARGKSARGKSEGGRRIRCLSPCTFGVCTRARLAKSPLGGATGGGLRISGSFEAGNFSNHPSNSCSGLTSAGSSGPSTQDPATQDPATQDLIAQDLCFVYPRGLGVRHPLLTRAASTIVFENRFTAQGSSLSHERLCPGGSLPPWRAALSPHSGCGVAGAASFNDEALNPSFREDLARRQPGPMMQWGNAVERFDDSMCRGAYGSSATAAFHES